MKHESNIIQHALDSIDNVEGVYGCDLHNLLFNEDYFIIGYYQAEEYLKNGPGVFDAIREIKEYEEDNFGEVSTDLSDSEKVVNMYAYIKGEKLLNDCSTVVDNWGNYLTEENIKDITKELNDLM